MSDTIEIRPQSVEATRGEFAFRGTTSVASSGFHASRSVPPTIPNEQRYYWSPRWQCDEHETVVALARGEGHVFSSGIDAVKWLFSEDD